MWGSVLERNSVERYESAVIFDQELWAALMAREASAYGKRYLEEDKLLLHQDASGDSADKQEMGGGPRLMH